MRRFAAISLGLHVVLLAGLLIWSGGGPRPSDAPDKEGAVELVMVEAQSAGRRPHRRNRRPKVPRRNPRKNLRRRLHRHRSPRI